MRSARNCWDLISGSVAMNLRQDVSSYYLKYAWWFIEPLMQFITLFIIFGIFQSPRISYYADFLLCGIIAWQWFARGVNNNAGSVLQSINISINYPVHTIFFPVITFIQDTIKHLLVFSIMLLFFAFLKGVSAAWIYLPLIFLSQGILVMGAGALGAALVPFVPDLRLIIGIIVSLMFFASGVFFDISTIVHPQYQQILYMNPMAVYISSYRSVLSHGQVPDLSLLCCALGVSMAILILAGFLLIRFNSLYTRISK